MSKNLNKKGYHFPEAVKLEACIGCLKCAVMCPDTAIKIARKKASKSPATSCTEKK